MSARLDPLLEMGWLALVLGAALLPSGSARRLSGAGLAALGLGLAAWQASPGAGPPPPEFVAVNAGLMLLGIGGALVSAWRAAWAGRQGYLAAAATIAGALMLGPPLFRFMAPAPPALAAAALTALASGGVLLGYASTILRQRWVRPRAAAPSRSGSHWPALLLAGALATGLGSHLVVVFLGAVAAAVAGWRLGAEGGARTLPLVPVLVLVGLAPAYRLFAVIAGEEGLGLRTLADLPLSPAAESLLAPLVLLAAWSLTGLWPLPRRTPAGLTAAVGLLLAARVALAALPSGLEHWRPVAFPVLLLGLWQATAAGRWPALAGGAALLGLVSGSPEGVTGAWWLGGAALALEGSSWLTRRQGSAASLLERAGILLGGWGALPVLAAGLGVEVVYTAFAVAGVALALPPGPSRQPVEPR